MKQLEEDKENLEKQVDGDENDNDDEYDVDDFNWPPLLSTENKKGQWANQRLSFSWNSSSADPVA